MTAMMFRLLAPTAAVLAAGLITFGPAVAGPTDVGRPTAESAAAEAPVSFDDLRAQVAQFEAGGEVTFAGARRLEASIDRAQHGAERGTPSVAIFWLEELKRTASDQRYVPSPAARDELVATADRLIGQLAAGMLPDARL